MHLDRACELVSIATVVAKLNSQSGPPEHISVSGQTFFLTQSPYIPRLPFPSASSAGIPGPGHRQQSFPNQSLGLLFRQLLLKKDRFSSLLLPYGWFPYLPFSAESVAPAPWPALQPLTVVEEPMSENTQSLRVGDLWPRFPFNKASFLE